MKKIEKKFRFLLVLMALFGFGLSYFGIPKIFISDFSYVLGEGTENQIRFFAKRVFYETTDHTIRGEAVTIRIPSGKGSEIKVKGNLFKFFRAENRFEIFDDVKVLFEDGFEITTSYLDFWNEKNLIIVPKDRRIIASHLFKKWDQSYFSTNGIEIDTKKLHLDLKNQVVFELKSKKARRIGKNFHIGFVRVESDMSTIDHSSREVHFLMDPKKSHEDRFVKVSFTSLELRGREAMVVGSERSKKDTRILIKKDIEIKEPFGDQKFSGSCQLVEITANLGIVALKNYPRIHLGETLFTGEEIVLDRNADTLEVKNSNGLLSQKQLMDLGRSPANR